jgi:hypothetical protein
MNPASYVSAYITKTRIATSSAKIIKYSWEIVYKKIKEWINTSSSPCHNDD